MAAAGRLPNYKSNLREQDYAEVISLVPETRTQDGTLHSFLNMASLRSFENMAATGRLPNYKSGLPEQD